MSVDGTRGAQVTINFDITFPRYLERKARKNNFVQLTRCRMPCCLISIELEDMAQNVQHNIESRIKKMRLNLQGVFDSPGQMPVLKPLRPIHRRR